MESIKRNYIHRAKYNQKPFSFRWEVEQLPLRLRAVDDRFYSPDFEAAPGVRMYVRLDRAKVDDEEWLSAYLFMNPESSVKEATMTYSIALLRSPPKPDHRNEVNQMKQFNGDGKNYGWGFNKFVLFSNLVKSAEGYLKDESQLLTVLVEGNVFSGEQPDERKIILMPDKNSADSEISIWKQTSENYGKLFDEGILADFVVKAKDARGTMKELKVHKTVLAASSEFFLAMLSKPKVKESREGMVEIEDIQFNVMETLIRFLYTGKLAPVEGSEKGTDELGLLVAADKYRIEGLKKLVEHRLSASLSVENVCGRLAHAERHKAPFLKARCIEFIHHHRNEVSKTEGLQQLCAEFSHLMGDLLKDR